jgi:hypothetical protein
MYGNRRPGKNPACNSLVQFQPGKRAVSGAHSIIAGPAQRCRTLVQSVFLLSGLLADGEPSTWAMLLIGFVGIGFASYRKSRRREFHYGTLAT